MGEENHSFKENKMTKLAAIIAYWCGLDSLFYWLNRNAKRIITFHNVLPDELFRSGVANGVSSSLTGFKAIISECGKRFKFSTELSDSKTLTITFDDGYRNQYTTAFKALREKGISAYLFVSGDIAKGGIIIDKLLHWVAEAPIDYIPNGDRVRYWCNEIWPAFAKDCKGRGANVLKMLDQKYPYNKVVQSLSKEYMSERMGAISDEELFEMRNAGWKIGWHTWSHYTLSKLSEEDIRYELESPQEYRSVCLSFPYGNPCEVGETAIRMAKDLGYPCALSNTNTSMHSKYFLPRMALSSDRYLLHFELSGCKHFLKTRKLLPVVR